MTNGQEVYVYEHIYESISQLPENKVGGMWLPDELSRFLQKAKQYRKLFTESQDVYFKRIQVWGEYSPALAVMETHSRQHTYQLLLYRQIGCGNEKQILRAS